MKFLAAIFALTVALSQALAQATGTAKPYETTARRDTDGLEMSMAFLKEPLLPALLTAPELIMERIFRDAKKNPALSQQSIYTIRAIGATFKSKASSVGAEFKALKDLKTRQAAINYAESLAAMSNTLAGHLSGAESTVPDIVKLIDSVNQRRAELVTAFPALNKPK